MKVDLQFDQITPNPQLCVAVVGSSERLLEKLYGELIDSHDVVIRCNRAPIDEKYTGKKTDIRIINCHLITDVENDETASLHTDTFSSYDRNFIKGVEGEHIILKSRDVFLVTKNAYLIEGIKEKNKFSTIDYPSLEEIAKGSGGSEPSCGWVAINLALSYFGNVNVFGFNMDKDNDWMNHYYEKINPYGAPHMINKEQESIRGLETEGRVKLL